MKMTCLAATALFLTGCSTAEEQERAALMDEIERLVRLPKGARGIDNYARYYADNGSGEIEAVYLEPPNRELLPGESCEDLVGRAVPCEDIEAEGEIQAGQRRWLDGARALPSINDGGCMQITIVFDRTRSVVKSTECNGPH